MESLSKRSDGFWETSSGLFATVPIRYSELENGNRSFRYKSEPYADTTAIEWRGDVAVLPDGVVRQMLSKGYGSHPTDEQAQAYNNEYASEGEISAPDAEKTVEGDIDPDEAKEAQKPRKTREKRKTSKPKE